MGGPYESERTTMADEMLQAVIKAAERDDRFAVARTRTDQVAFMGVTSEITSMLKSISFYKVMTDHSWLRVTVVCIDGEYRYRVQASHPTKKGKLLHLILAKDVPELLGMVRSFARTML